MGPWQATGVIVESLEQRARNHLKVFPFENIFEMKKEKKNNNTGILINGVLNIFLESRKKYLKLFPIVPTSKL